jgi:hypothetical protein
MVGTDSEQAGYEVGEEGACADCCAAPSVNFEA